MRKDAAFIKTDTSDIHFTEFYLNGAPYRRSSTNHAKRKKKIFQQNAPFFYHCPPLWSFFYGDLGRQAHHIITYGEFATFHHLRN